MGRLAFYLNRAREQKRKHGYAGALALTWDFLKRRQFFLQFFFEWFEYQVTSRSRSISATLIKTLKSSPLTSPKIMLYASYDCDSVILPHVVQQVSYFKSVGYQIIWVSTSPEVSPIEFSKIEAYVAIALHRKNEGYDFASWGLGYQYLNANSLKPSSLIIMNDSCLGPYYDFTAQLTQIEKLAEAAYGITKSYEIAEYIQSYFIHFGRKLIESGIVSQYFDRIRILKSKWGIVRFFEIGGSTFLRRIGSRLFALIDPAEPKISKILLEENLLDPVREPAAREWIKKEWSPFYKRSNETH